jgi:hypothetical protein
VKDAYYNEQFPSPFPVETVKETYTDAGSVDVRLRVYLTAVGCFVGGVIELVISIRNGELMRVTNRRCS